MQVAITHSHYTDHGAIPSRYPSDLARHLLDAGHDVHYYCRAWEGDVDPRVNLHRIPGRLSRIRFLSAWSYDRWLTRRVSRSEFDVVHGFSQSSEQDIVSARVVPGAPGDPTPSLHHRQVQSIAARRFTRGNFHKVVTPSQIAADLLKERYGLSDDEVTTVRDGVDLERFHPRNRATYREAYRERIVVPQDCFIVLTKGSGFNPLGVPTLIEAARLVRERGGLPDGRQLRIAVVGHDTQKTERALSKLCKEKGVWSDVKFYGPQDELPERWFAMADLFAHPAKSNVVSCQVLHALATGIPALVSSGAGTSELIREAENGHVVDPNDASGIAEHLMELAGDTDRHEQMSAAARASVEGLSWDAHFTRILALYEEVAALKKRPASLTAL